MPTLEETYHEIKQFLGDHIEPLKSVQLVDEYRRYWRPENVRVVLLAESHVFTSDEDRRIVIPPIDDLPGYPGRYARFVYCLACSAPQFWKVLYACSNPISTLQEFAPVQSVTSLRQRLLNKISLLKTLKARGIWLLDASIVALYRGGEKDLRIADVIRKSWQSYSRQIITSANPDHVICVGKGVAQVVEDDLRILFSGRYTVISQPNARRRKKQSLEDFRKKQLEDYQRYYRICNP